MTSMTRKSRPFHFGFNRFFAAVQINPVLFLCFFNQTSGSCMTFRPKVMHDLLGTLLALRALHGSDKLLQGENKGIEPATIQKSTHVSFRLPSQLHSFKSTDQSLKALVCFMMTPAGEIVVLPRSV